MWICSTEGRIVGPADVVTQPVGYMVSVRGTKGEHVCGGSLIHPRVVLTAAHCVRTLPNPEVHMGRLRREGGASGIEISGTEKVIVHPEYGRAARYVLHGTGHDATSSTVFWSFSALTCCCISNLKVLES